MRLHPELLIPLVTVLFTFSCGGDTSNSQTSPGQQPGTVATWNAGSGTVICAPGDSSCVPADGFTVSSDGRYWVDDEPVGRLTQQELAGLIGPANEVAAQDLGKDLTCLDPGEDGVPSFVADGITLSIRIGADEEPIRVLDQSTEGGTCFRGTRERATAFGAAMIPLISKYAVPGATPTHTPICTQTYVYGVVLELKNALGDPVTDATATLRDGSFEQAMISGDGAPPGIYQGAGERAGVYALRVSAPGYLAHEETDIVVGEDECHVFPVKRQIVLKSVTSG